MNTFLVDGVTNLKRSSAIINFEMSADDTCDAVLYFAFGVERLCKGLLFDVNPALILAFGKYADLVKLCYMENVIDQNFISQNQSKGVQAANFSDLLVRAALFSTSCIENKATLSNLKKYRNILAHQKLTDFQDNDVKKWLFGVYFPVVQSFATELGLDVDEIFVGRNTELEQYAITAQHQKVIAQRVESFRKTHEGKWSKSKSTSAIAMAEKATALDLNQPRNTQDNSYEEYPCPACENPAVLEIEPDFDYADGHSYVTGVYPNELRCHYCGFRVIDYEDLSYLELDTWWER